MAGLAPQLHVLPYELLWERFVSREFKFDRLIDVKRRSVSVVEFRALLNSTRAGALDAAAHENDPAFVMQQAEQYLARLAYLQKHAASLTTDGKGELVLRTTWASPLSPTGMFGAPQVNTSGDPAQEYALMLLRWVTAAWQLAQQRMQAINPEPGPPTTAQPESTFPAVPAPLDVAVASECTSLLRRAAGAAELLADTLLPAAFGPADGDAVDGKPARAGPVCKAPEVQPWFARVLSRVLLGQAQFVVAHRAYCKGTSHDLAARLYVGASDLFEEASVLLRVAEATARVGVPSQFRKLVALCSTLAVARARSCAVHALMAVKNAGAACVAAKHAQNELAQCGYVAEGRSDWAAVVAALSAEADAIWAAAEADRVAVYMQPLSRESPGGLPEGRQLVEAAHFEAPQLEVDLDLDPVVA